MKLSHSKLATILSCPMTYYLSYIQGISKKVEKPALAIGSAVHWGIEHNTEDLTQYFIDNGSVKSRVEYTRDQLLAESMVHGYLKHKDEIFGEILMNNETGEPLELLDESHELYVTGDLQSSATSIIHKFVGIIDLLLLTDKGFIVIDYKTSSQVPHWDGYLDQIYRYIFMLNTMFPDVPIVKIGIVNLRKTGIRQKKSETRDQFLNRLRFEYTLNDENYVNYHEFVMSALDPKLIKDYTRNLAKQCDLAHMIDEKKIRFINYGAAEGQYGKSDYWDIFYRTPDAYVLYKIYDKVWDEETNSIVSHRDCVPIDMYVIDSDKVLNKFSIYEDELKNYVGSSEDFIAHLKEEYDYVDDSLLKLYAQTHEKLKAKEEENEKVC